MIPWILICVVILAINVIRFLGLEISPPGFYLDEAFGATHILCIKETGHDFFGESFALFSKVYSYGFQTAPYLYSEALWTSIFGTSITALRSFAGFVTLITIFGIMKLVQELTKEWKYALIAGVLASIMPWSFQFSRISWDPPMGPMFLVWSIYFIYKTSSRAPLFTFRILGHEFVVELNSLMGGALLAIAGYTYSPMRVQVALMVLFLPGISWKKKGVIATVFGLVCIPAAFKYLDPNFTVRSKMLAITSDYPGNPYRNENFFGLVLAYGSQVLKHLTPEFLLQSGDHNLRHSIQTFGQMDWVTAFGVLATGVIAFTKNLRKKLNWDERHVVMIKLSILGTIAGITPAALTWEGVPHAIRSLGAWPFMVILATLGLGLIIQKVPKLIWAFTAASVVFFTLYVQDYFENYPKIAEAWFDVSIVERAERGEFPKDYGPLARGYFLMSRQGVKCDDIPR